ncbi:hypothetical protein LINPERPRIM_LOCUS24221 [Linum perenne]
MIGVQGEEFNGWMRM